MSLEAAAAKWSEAHPDEAPPAPTPPPTAPGSHAEPVAEPSSSPAGSASSTSQPEPEPAAEPSPTALPMEEIAAFGVGLIDAGLQNFVSPRCAFKPEQRAELAELGAAVLRKWLPSLEGAVEPEYAFAGSVALFAYVNYQSSAPPKKAPASPPGGGGGSGGGVGGSTSASVDGRPVNAEVLQ